MQQNKLKIIRRNYKLKAGDIVCIAHLFTDKGQHYLHHVGIVLGLIGKPHPPNTLINRWYHIQINDQYSQHDNTVAVNTKDTEVVKLRKL